MLTSVHSPALLAVSAALALLGAWFAVRAASALRGRRVLAFSRRSLTGLLFSALSALGLTLTAATQGYRAFTREEVAAEVHVVPAGPQRFIAKVVLPDGREVEHRLNGDQLYVDAHILKWKPLVNVLGLHTAYELDRLGGRYRTVEDEQNKSRTVVSLAEEKNVDLFDLRRRFGHLALLVDAEYGSATFIDVTEPSVFEVRVSTSGLLVRRKP